MARNTRTEATILGEDRARIAAILGSPEGLRNPALAHELAVVAGMSATQAHGILKMAPAANPYTAAMSAFGPIGVSGPTSGGTTDPKAARLAEIKASADHYLATRGTR